MRLLSIVPDSVVDGTDLRSAIFISGCQWACPQCHNEISHNLNNGELITPIELLSRVESTFSPLTAGITMSGGDPLFIANRQDVHEFLKLFKKKHPNMTVWMYTGYKFEAVRHLSLMKYVDYIVDDVFKYELRDLSAYMMGSTNQRLIHVPTGKVLTEHGRLIEGVRLLA